ncbi:MAG TPA: hypothetical protein DDZ96_14935 [Porphyromonadaceae bacterium]|jgi:hypothetical protein|nr:hypothetical protein [Porphyromonadaceae bacterium]HBX19272.1 hypothetical protein [Porphyromonadaceae bacterium]HCM20453.1 hypothetical protein [Porphyromonadaceae bacterium]
MQKIKILHLIYNIAFAGRPDTKTGNFQIERIGTDVQCLCYFNIAWACLSSILRYASTSYRSSVSSTLLFDELANVWKSINR